MAHRCWGPTQVDPAHVCGIPLACQLPCHRHRREQVVVDHLLEQQVLLLLLRHQLSPTYLPVFT